MSKSEITHCIFDKDIFIDTKIIKPQAHFNISERYTGLRQIDCPRGGICSLCGWNPAVEAERKAEMIRGGEPDGENEPA